MWSIACLILEVLTWLLQDLGVLEGVEESDKSILRGDVTWETGCVFWHRLCTFSVKEWTWTLSHHLTPESALGCLFLAARDSLVLSRPFTSDASDGPDQVSLVAPPRYKGAETHFVCGLQHIFSADVHLALGSGV